MKIMFIFCTHLQYLVTDQIIIHCCIFFLFSIHSVNLSSCQEFQLLFFDHYTYIMFSKCNANVSQSFTRVQTANFTCYRLDYLTCIELGHIYICINLATYTYVQGWSHSQVQSWPHIYRIGHIHIFIVCHIYICVELVPYPYVQLATYTCV